MCISTPRSSLVVRFLSVFLLCCSSLYASIDQTGKQKITVVGNDVTLETVFKQIEKQTGLRFMYAVDAVDVKEKVTVMFENVMLDEVLESLLGKKGIEWVYREGIVSLKQREGRKVTNDMNVIPNAGLLINVSGKVLDVKGNPVPFASVMVKGAKKGIRADEDGKFILRGVELNSTLRISSIGFETKEVLISGTSLVVRMNQEVGILGEKVIKGYYSTTARLNTGDITSIRFEEIEKQPVSNPILALQGRVPGMLVTQTTGLPGGKVDVQIRGRNSINNGTQPLFIVDGVPYDGNLKAPPTGFYGAISNVMSALNFLNPSDIESIDVLKDADATAIYGSRGANGVVLINTKKGKIGIPRIVFNVNRGFQTVSQRIKMLNTPEYLALRREAFKNDGVEPTIESAPDLMVWDTTRYTDWRKVLLGGTAAYTDAQASISGGNTTVQYLIGGNYHKETTAYPGDFFSRRGGAHFNIIGNSTDQSLRVSLTGNYTINQSNYPGFDMTEDVMLPPNAPAIYDENGHLNWEGSTWNNPFRQLISSIAEAETNSLVSNIDISYQVLAGLVIKANVGFNEFRNNTFSGTTIAGVPPAERSFATASARYLTSKVSSWISEPQISYRRLFGKSDFELLTGVTLLGNSNEGQTVHTDGILQDALIRFPAAATSYSAYGAGSKYKYSALFGRLSYNFLDRYLLNLTIRKDGSSRFGPKKQFATFGAIGFGWIFSQEGVFQKLFPFISFGKLRGSFGITGNDQIGDYQYLNQYRFVEQTYQGEKGLRVIGLFNPDFVWERTKKTELGLEIGFLKDRILLTSNVYRNISNNQLLSYPLPSMTGSTAVTGNLPARIRNQGFEFVLCTRNILKETISWTTNFNLSISKNKLLSNGGIDVGVDEGNSLSTIYLTKNAGVDPNTGGYLFENAEGKPVEDFDADFKRQKLDLAPSFFGGIQNSIQYKGIQLDFFFQYCKQNGSRGLFYSGALPGTMYNVPIEVSKRWNKPGDLGPIQRANQDYSLYSAYNTWLRSNESYGSASFIRCKNISLSWAIPPRWISKFHLKNGRIYIQGQNLFLITNYSGLDPETQSPASMPPMRALTAGIQVSL